MAGRHQRALNDPPRVQGSNARRHSPLQTTSTGRSAQASPSNVLTEDLDTRPTPNVTDLAHGADLLVHEMIDREWVCCSLLALTPEKPCFTTC
jgi:ribonuclease BN (tRNA processing enzyme)